MQRYIVALYWRCPLAKLSLKPQGMFFLLLAYCVNLCRVAVQAVMKLKTVFTGLVRPYFVGTRDLVKTCKILEQILGVYSSFLLGF